VQLTDIAGEGVHRILNERRRQITEEGWTPEHDFEHGGGDLARAAVAYVLASYEDGLFMEGELDVSDPTAAWPWPDGWKPSGDPIRNLTKAGALIAAEIDRLLEVRRSG
jgi:hypothetical protein